jgi:SSS family transporter
VTPVDYAVLIFYFAFMLAISFAFRRFVTDVSDYFRGGGKALWWMVGGSAFMVQFSAWTFTGAASQAYAYGWPIMTIFLANAVGFMVNALYFAPRFRQMRVITGVDAIRHRFGRVSEQFFTWLQLPTGLLGAGIWLNSLAVFLSAVFGFDLSATILVTGIVVLVMALIGGSWAVLASDFIQVLILMPVCLAITLLAVARVGGWGGFFDALPAGHLDVSQVFDGNFLALWCVAMVIKQLHTTNNLNDAGRYLCAKDSRHARAAGLFGAALFVLGIVTWFVPPMAAAILFPDLSAEFPNLRNPAEGAFIAISREVMPVGMMGLLVSGIFAATMSSMDSGLNKNSGFFVKNFYQPVVRPAATDAHLLRVGKLSTLVLGVLVILVALEMSRLRDLSLFQLTQRFSILIGVPTVVPLFLGLLVRRTPPWSGWSTVCVGFLSSLFITRFLTPEWAAATWQGGVPLDAAGREYWRQGVELIGNITVCSLWFIGTALFWRRSSSEHRERVTGFFTRLEQPVDFDREEGASAANDVRQLRVTGWLCAAYGAMLLVLIAVPNSGEGRLAFAGCAALVLGVATTMIWHARRVERRLAATVSP